MATTRKRSTAKTTRGASARKLAVKKETLKDLTPARAPKGGAIRKTLSIKDSMTCAC